ncbi:hypothetical protein C8J57DRAFT_1346580 [Mycena rebaudengoi]|nr:hypothetical protein C8J57DRAFT_1346580 [Mycena rebaudengoi]
MQYSVLSSLCMNYPQDASPGHELRIRVHAWLTILRQRARNFTHALLSGTPNVVNPFPAGFPFNDVALSGIFQFAPILSLELWAREDNDWLGIFEIAGAIYDDPYRPFDVTADLVLEAMQESVDYYVPVRLSSYDVQDPGAESPTQPPADYWVRQYVLTSPGGEVYRQIGARFLQECLVCRTHIVHPGPNICAGHA